MIQAQVPKPPEEPPPEPIPGAPPRPLPDKPPPPPPTEPPPPAFASPSDGLDPFSWTPIPLGDKESTMSNTRAPYSPAFRQQMVELVRAGCQTNCRGACDWPAKKGGAGGVLGRGARPAPPSWYTASRNVERPMKQATMHSNPLRAPTAPLRLRAHKRHRPRRRADSGLRLRV